MTPLERFILNSSTLLVGLSGALYAIMKYLMTPSDPYAAVNHPLQPWVLDLHVLGGPALVFAVGLIARDHILQQWRKGGNGQARLSGMLAMWCLLPMISTGYLIQIFTDETARLVCVAIHLGTGLFYLSAFAVHLSISRRVAARRREAGGPGAIQGIATSSSLRARAASPAGVPARRGGPL